MADNGLGFLGFPSWDPTGAILLNNPSYGLPQDVSVYDLMARGYMPGDPNAFHSLLPNLTTPAQIANPITPQAGFYPTQDYGYVTDLINAMGNQRSGEMGQKLLGTGATVAKDLYKSWDAPTLPSGADSTPIDAFGAGMDFGTEGTGVLDSLSGLYGMTSPYLPYVGAILGALGGFMKGGEKGLLAGAGTLGGAAIGTAAFPGVGTAIGATLGSLLGELGGPSKAWMTFPTRVGKTLSAEQRGAQGLSTSLSQAKTLPDVYNALLDFRGNIGSTLPYGGQNEMFVPWALHPDKIMELDPSFKEYKGLEPETGNPVYGLSTNNLEDLRHGNDALTSYLRELEQGDLPPANELFKDVGSYANTTIPYLPGATGTEHEGKLTFDAGPMTEGLRNQLAGTVESIYGKRYKDPASTFASALSKARSPGEIETALRGLYGGIGDGYGAGAPSIKSFGSSPSNDLYTSVIPDFPGLHDQSVPAALRQELGSAYSGAINKANPFTGRQGLPVPEGASGDNSGQPGQKTTRLSVAAGRGDALGNAIFDAQSFLGG